MAASRHGTRCGTRGHNHNPFSLRVIVVVVLCAFKCVASRDIAVCAVAGPPHFVVKQNLPGVGTVGTKFTADNRTALGGLEADLLNQLFSDVVSFDNRNLHHSHHTTTST